MRTSMWMAAVALAAAGQAHAQTAEPSAAPAALASQGGADGVIVYPTSFFADAQPNTAMDMVRRVPGFSFNPGDQVRGFGGAAGNVLIDGSRPSSKRDNLEAILYRIPASQVERVELIRGGAPGIDMQGQTVLLNVVRKQGASSQGLIAVASQFYQDGRQTPAMRVEGSRRWDDKFVEGSVLLYSFVDDGAGEGPRVIRDKTTGAVEQRAFADETADGQGVDAKGSFETGAFGGKLRTNLTLQAERYDFELEDVTTASDGPPERPPVGYTFLVDDDFERLEGELGVNWQRKLGPRTDLEVLAIQQLRRTDFASDFADGTDAFAFTEDTLKGESIARAKLSFRRSDTLSFEGGGEVAYNFLDSQTSFTFNGAPVALPASDVLVQERRAEAFAAGTWRATPKLTLEAGGKVEYSVLGSTQDVDTLPGPATVENEKTFVYPKPRLVATWSPNEQNQLRLRVEREVGQLNFGDFVSSTALSSGDVTAGNVDIEPDKTWVFEAAYERRFWEKGAFVVTYRHAEITDVVDRVVVYGDQDDDGLADDVDTDDDNDSLPDVSDPDNAPQIFDSPGNIGDGVSDEIALNLTLPLDRLKVRGGLLKAQATWRESEVVDSFTLQPRRISGQHPFSGEIHFSQDVPKWKLNWGADAFLGFEETYYRFDETFTIELQPWYALWAEWKPRPNLSVRAELANLAARDFKRRWDRANEVETKDLNFDPFVYVRVRRTFG